MEMIFCRTPEEPKLPAAGDLMYVQLEDGTRVPLIVTASKTEDGKVTLRALVDPTVDN